MVIARPIYVGRPADPIKWIVSPQTVTPEFVVQGGAVDIENPSSAREVALRLPQNTLDVHSLDIVQSLAALSLILLELEEEVRRTDLWAAPHYQRPFYGIFEFADIARPIIPHEQFQRLGR